jgi:hypothetical protein
MLEEPQPRVGLHEDRAVSTAKTARIAKSDASSLGIPVAMYRLASLSSIFSFSLSSFPRDCTCARERCVKKAARWMF